MFALIILLMPKHLSLIEYFTSSLLNIIIQLITDVYFQFSYHQYGYFSRNQLDLQSWLIFFLIYPAINIIFINFYPVKRKALLKAVYILAFSVFSVVYEWLSLKAGAFYYTGWKLWYSALFYPALFIMLWLNLKIVQKVLSVSRLQ
jgi:hypothetical protein